MYTDDQAIRQFKRMHARDMMALEAHHIDEDHDADAVQGHLTARDLEESYVRIGFFAALLVLSVAGAYILWG